MENRTNTVVGKAYWAKVLGSPGPAYNEGEREWSVDVALEAEALEAVTKLGLGPKVKNNGDDRGNFITFRRRELKKRSGQPNQPIAVYALDGVPWNGGLIGNGSQVRVKFNVYTSPGFGKKPPSIQPAILSIDILTHIPYERSTDGEPPKAPPGAGSYKESWKGDVV